MAQLQAVNYANVAAFIVNVVVTYGINFSGYFPTNAELSAKYQTLVTPAGYAFSIWSFIFLGELAWTILQMLPNYRSCDLVVKGVGYWYVAVCMYQCAWGIVFSKELVGMKASLVAMFCILVSLVHIVNQSYKLPSTSLVDSLILKLPFQVHCAWIWAASIVNVNVVLVASYTPTEQQIFAAWASLVCLSVLVLYYAWRQVYMVPIVLSWAAYAISVQLRNPRDFIVTTFATSTIHSLQIASKDLAVVSLVGTVVILLVTQIAK